jgi:hypothetical protein
MQAGATTIKLMADIADVQRKFAEVQSLAQRTASNVGAVFDKLGLRLAAGLSLTGVIAGMVAATRQLGVMANEVDRFAKLSGTTAREFQAMEFAVKSVGMQGDKLADILKDVQDKVGDFLQTGAGPMADFFENIAPKVGVTAEQFRGLGGRDALQLYVSSLQKANLSQAEMTFYMEAIASDSTLLLPLLQDNAKGFNDMADQAERLGVVLDDHTIASAQELHRNIDALQQVVESTSATMASRLVPVLNEIVRSMLDSSGGTNVFKAAGNGLALVMETLVLIGSDVAFVFRGIGREIGGIAAQAAAVLSGNFAGAKAIREAMIADAEADRARLDSFQRRLVQARAVSDALVNAAEYDEPRYRRALAETSKVTVQAGLNAKQRAEAEKAAAKAVKDAAKLEAEALKARIEAAKYANAQWDEDFKRIEDAREATENRIRTGREMLEQIKFETKLLGMSSTEREIAVALLELERQGVVKGTEAYKAFAEEIRNGIMDRESKRQAIEYRQNELAEWKKHWEQVSQSFTDALMQGGKSVAEYLKGLFRTLVLRPLLQPIIAGVGGFMSSAASAMGMGPEGAGGATGSTLNILSSVKSAYNAISTGFTSLGNSVAFAADSMGAWLVNNTSGVLNQMGGSLMQSAGSLGTAASYLGGAAAGMALGQIISGGYSAIGKNPMFATAAGTAAGAAIGAKIGSIGGPLGAVIGGALGGLFNRAFGRKAPVTTGSGITGTFSTEGASVMNYQEWFQKGGWFRSNKSGVNYSAVSSELDQFLDDALKQMTAATKMYANLLSLNAEAINGITQSVRISLMGMSAEQQQQAIMGALSGFADRLAQAYANPFIRAGETAGEALARLANSLVTVNQVFDTLNQTLLQSTLVGGEAASALLDVFGGADAFVQATSAYYNAFYTEAERTAISTRQLTEVLASMGMELPATREGFRALVESQNLYTEAGRENYAALIRLSAVFDEITPKVDTLAGQLGRLVQGMIDSTLAGVDEQISASQRAANAARESARAYYDAAQSLRASAGSLFGQTMNSSQSVDFLRMQFQSVNSRAQTGDVDAMQAAGGAGAAFIDAYRKTAATRSDFIKQTLLVQNQLEQTAAVADVMGDAADYQAMLFDVNTAMLEVLREMLQSGDVTEELLRGQLNALNNLSDMISASQSMTVEVYRNESGMLRAGLVDGNGRVVRTLDHTTALQLQGLATQNSHLVTVTGIQTSALSSVFGSNSSAIKAAVDANRDGIITKEEIENAKAIGAIDRATALQLQGLAGQTVTFTNTITGQTTTYGKLTNGQLLELKSISGSTKEAASLTDLVAIATGDSVNLMGKVLSRLGDQVVGLDGLATKIVQGNAVLASNLKSLVDVMLKQQEDEAAARRVMDDSLKAQFKTLADKGAAASLQLPKAEAEELRRARELVANYIRFGNVQNSLGVTAPAEIARLQVWSDTLSNSLNRLSGVSDSQVISFAETLLSADTGRLRAGLGSTSSFTNAKNRFSTADSREDELISEIQRIRETLKALSNDRPDLFPTIPKFAAGGMHAGGLRLVGENGPELEATGPSRIYNANQTAAMLGGGGAVADEIRALREEVAMLRYEARATAVNTSKTHRLLDDVTQGGTTIRTTEVVA